MNTRIVRIGNSRGIRIPKRLLELYGLSEGDSLELDETREGIVLRPLRTSDTKLDWAEAYRQMATDSTERSDWSEWDVVVGDGIDD